MAVRHRHDFYFLRTERLKAYNKIDFDTRTTEHNSICTYINRINGCPRQRIYTDSQPPPSNPKGKCLKRTSFVVVSISKLFSNPPTLSTIDAQKTSMTGCIPQRPPFRAFNNLLHSILKSCSQRGKNKNLRGEISNLWSYQNVSLEQLFQ